MARPPVLVSPAGSDTVSETTTKVCVSGPCDTTYYIRIYQFDKDNPSRPAVDITRKAGDPANAPANTSECVPVKIYCTPPYDGRYDEGIGCADVVYDASGLRDIVIGIVSVDGGGNETQVIGGKFPITRVSLPVPK